MAVSTLVTAIAIAAAGVAAVAAVAWAFYLVGRSEDRDRAGGPGPAGAPARQIEPADPGARQTEPVRRTPGWGRQSAGDFPRQRGRTSDSTLYFLTCRKHIWSLN